MAQNLLQTLLATMADVLPIAVLIVWVSEPGDSSSYRNYEAWRLVSCTS